MDYKKMKITALIIIFLIGVVWYTNVLNKSPYTTITPALIKELSVEEELMILEYKIQNKSDVPFALIYFSKDGKIGAGYLTVKNNNPEFIQDIIVPQNIDRNIELIGSTGKYTYIAMSINNKDLRNKGNRIILTGTTSQSEEINGNRHFIFLKDSSVFKKIEIVSYEGEVLFEQEI